MFAEFSFGKAYFSVFFREKGGWVVFGFSTVFEESFVVRSILMFLFQPVVPVLCFRKLCSSRLLLLLSLQVLPYELSIHQ